MSTDLPPILGPGVLIHRLGSHPEPDWLMALRRDSRVVPAAGGQTALCNERLGEVFRVSDGDWVCYFTNSDRLAWSSGGETHSGARSFLEVGRIPPRRGPEKEIAPEITFPPRR